VRLRRHEREEGDPVREHETIAIGAVDLDELTTLFASPRWLRDLGRSAWLLVGVAALLAVIIWLLGTTYEIVGPVVAGTIVATVAMPAVSTLQRHRVPRAAGAAIVLLGLAAIGALVLLLVLGGITAQEGDISEHATQAADRAQGWLNSAGVDESGSSKAKSDVESSVPQIISTLTKGVLSGIKGIASLAFALSFTLLSLFFILKDGPSMRGWVDRHLGLPLPVAQTVTGGVIKSLRGYFRGVTIVAVFNGFVVAVGALILGVPLAGTIGVVTAVTAYIPYIGAFVSGAFAVIIALGANGPTTALIMLVIVILANGLLQNIVQPFAMGAALDLHPLAVLVISIGAGCIFGMIGLVLAAPLTSAAVHITRDLAQARVAARIEAETREGPPAGAEPAPAG
jgi:predicted PurR-regulated permease PerM